MQHRLATIQPSRYTASAAPPLPRPCLLQVVDLDRGLTASQKAEAAAFAALVEAKLQPALVYTTWVEGDAFAQHTRGAYGAGLPFPLSFFIPRAQRRAVLAHFAGTTAAQVRACEEGGCRVWGGCGALGARVSLLS